MGAGHPAGLFTGIYALDGLFKFLLIFGIISKSHYTEVHLRLKSIEQATIGEVLGKPVYDDKCQLLLAKDIVLTQNYIDRLKLANIQCIYIEDAISEGLVLIIL